MTQKPTNTFDKNHAKPTDKLADCYEKFEKRITNILTIGLTSIGLVVAAQAAITVNLMNQQTNQVEKTNEVFKEVDEVKRDFGSASMQLHGMFPNDLVHENNYIKYVLKRGPVE